ncbi:toll/interleukin-1 receptor domain-containing protein [Sorangium sp. So ce128]|uniref:toll/interleukin-1 receptor domain-containing protein n=1 Tax=Sorangium sp. So ce128 TaxID=3133281 RepID=UPI003F5DB29A
MLPHENLGPVPYSDACEWVLAAAALTSPLPAVQHEVQLVRDRPDDLAAIASRRTAAQRTLGRRTSTSRRPRSTLTPLVDHAGVTVRMALLGDRTVTEVRGSGDGVLAEIVEVTRLPPRLVRLRLDSARGNAQLRSVFVNEWPDLAGELGKQTVAAARTGEYGHNISQVTTLDPQMVEFVLDQVSGKMHIQNAFNFAWPGKVDREEREVVLSDILGNLRVATVRHYDLFGQVARTLGVDESGVRLRLSRHRGHKLLKNISLVDVVSAPPSDEPDVESSTAAEETMLSQLPKDGSAIGNGKLRNHLAWDESKYYSVRAKLLEGGLIWLGKGRGGSVMLASGWTESRRNELMALVPVDRREISDATLIRQLGWEAEFYDQIRDQLIEEGLLRIAKARGGSVFRSELPPPPVPPVGARPHSSGMGQTSPASVFFCYAHQDEALRDELDVHLASLRREKLISQWYDRQIAPGTDWREAIDERLDRSNIVLILVSPHFVASDYCYEVEMTRAMNRFGRGEVLVIPIIVRPTDWNAAPFARLQALPKDAKPITSWPNRDEAWLDVARGLRTAISKLVRDNG